MNSQPAFLILTYFQLNQMTILSKGHKRDNFESHNLLKLSFTNIRGFHLNFRWIWIFHWIKLSWHSCSVWDKLGWLDWFWQFICQGLSSCNIRGNLKGFFYSYTWSCCLLHYMFYFFLFYIYNLYVFKQKVYSRKVLIHLDAPEILVKRPSQNSW